MVDLCIRHRTTYRYGQPVGLGPHRLMLRPREARDLRILSSTLTVRPDAAVNWAADVAGNTVATVTFGAPSAHLVIESVVQIALSALPYPVFDIAAAAITYPFRYSDDDWTDLAALTARQYPDTDRVHDWARGFVAGHSTDTLSLLEDINAGVGGGISYRSREDEGTQSPSRTLSSGQGSCRDLATLFVEAVRSLGFGARAVSGYLHDPTRRLIGSADAGSTHAWAEVYLPGAGWIAFDPTNRGMGGANLIPVAVARDIRLVMPVTGSFIGPPDAFLDLSVAVEVSQ